MFGGEREHVQILAGTMDALMSGVNSPEEMRIYFVYKNPTGCVRAEAHVSVAMIT
jgi:hypothetical protein